MDCIKKIDSLKIQFLDMLASLNSTQEAVASLPLNNTKFSPSSTLINKIKNHSLKKTIRGRNKTSEKSTPPSKRLLVENYILKCHPHNTDEQTELKKPEKVVLKDVLLVLNNIEGDHIKITEDGEIEFLDEQNGFLASLPPSLIDIALSCCRTGVFARLILGFLKENDGKESSIVWQRFCSVSREYVLDYLAFLRIRIAIDPISKTLENICSIFTTLQPPRSKTLAGRSNQSGPIVSLLYDVFENSPPHGALKTLAGDFFTQCAEPLWKMIFSWTTQGDLVDPFGEFFIFKAEDLENGPVFDIKLDSVPAFISPATASKIFQIGTTVRFIKEHSVKTVASEGKMEWGLSPRELEKAIERFERNLSERFIETLFDDFHFFRYFECIKRFVLHFQGDFMDFLMKSTV